MKVQCGNCRFWLELPKLITDDATTGLCQRFPPTVKADYNAFTQFPLLAASNTCGEWRPKIPLTEALVMADALESETGDYNGAEFLRRKFGGKE